MNESENDFSLEKFGQSMELSLEQDFFVTSMESSLQTAQKDDLIKFVVNLTRLKYTLQNVNKHLLEENLKLRMMVGK